MAPDADDELRRALRAALKENLSARDRAAADALRVAIAAIENLEAQPLDDVRRHQPTALEEAPASAEVARRTVSGPQARLAVETEIADLVSAATEYDDLGQVGAAERARHQAAVLRSVLQAAGATPEQ